MKRYETYKNSGVEWIGEIPNGWECIPMKRGMNIFNGKDYKDVVSDEGYPVIGSGGQFAFASEYLYDGEAVLLGRKGTIDKPLYINGKFWTVDTMFYAIPYKDVDCKYMYYQSLTIPFGKYSTSTALPSMTQTDLGNNPMCFPPLSEQQQISSYLDYKVGQIDTAIAKIVDQIDDLKSYRQSIISEAATKGLNPNAKMKDSGVEWIGEIPEGWDLKKIKYLKSTEPNAFVDGPFGSNLKSEHFVENGDVYVIESGTITTGKFIHKKFKTITQEHFESIKRSECRANDIIIAKIGANYGMAGELPLLDKPSVVSGNSLKITLDNTKILNSIFVYLLQLIKQRGAYIGLVQETAQPALSLLGMNNMLLPTPPLSEQLQIASYLDSKTSKIDSSIEALELQKSQLEDYKRSVISEAVTGKVDLRDWTPKNEQ